MEIVIETILWLLCWIVKWNVGGLRP